MFLSGLQDIETSTAIDLDINCLMLCFRADESKQWSGGHIEDMHEWELESLDWDRDPWEGHLQDEVQMETRASLSGHKTGTADVAL